MPYTPCRLTRVARRLTLSPKQICLGTTNVFNLWGGWSTDIVNDFAVRWCFGKVQCHMSNQMWWNHGRKVAAARLGDTCWKRYASSTTHVFAHENMQRAPHRRKSLSSNYSFFSGYVRFGGCKRLSCKLFTQTQHIDLHEWLEKVHQKCSYQWVTPTISQQISDKYSNNNIPTNWWCWFWGAIVQKYHAFQDICIPKNHNQSKMMNPYGWNHLRLGPTKPESVASFQEYGLPRVVHKHGKAPVVHLQTSENPIEKLSDTGTCEHAVALQFCMMEMLPVRILIMIIHHIVIACSNQIV